MSVDQDFDQMSELMALLMQPGMADRAKALLALMKADSLDECVGQLLAGLRPQGVHHG